jgi:hypothetical protein
MRMAFDEVADNPRSKMNPDYNSWYSYVTGIVEFKELLLDVRPLKLNEVTAMNADEIAILENDRKVSSTYHSHAQSTADDERGGRFASVNKARVSGTEPATIRWWGALHSTE